MNNIKEIKYFGTVKKHDGDCCSIIFEKLENNLVPIYNINGMDYRVLQ